MWRVVVELTFEEQPEDLNVDAWVTTMLGESGLKQEQANRGWDRVRGDLNRFVNEGPFAHYHVIAQPKRVD